MFDDRARDSANSGDFYYRYYMSQPFSSLESQRTQSGMSGLKALRFADLLGFDLEDVFLLKFKVCIRMCLCVLLVIDLLVDVIYKEWLT